MLANEAAAYLAGMNPADDEEASAPTNVHIISGVISGASEDGKAQVSIDGLMFSESDEQNIEIDTLGGLEDGDVVAVLLTGENGHGMAPLAIGAPGSVDRISLRVSEIEADYIKTAELEAEHALIEELEADNVTISGRLDAAEADIDDLEADTARIDTLVAGKADISSLNAATARIDTLEATDVTVNNRLVAAEAVINNLDSNYAQINMANVNNAWINNGTVKDGAITNAMINSVSANKLTAGTIDASNITVTNLNADNITTGTINGQRIGAGSLSLDKLSEDVYTESEVDGIVSNLQTQIDGAIETWTGTAVPTLQNSPASSWTTNAIKDTHVGDVYFVVNSQSQQNGYNYRFTKTGNTYSWQLIKDSDVTNALQRLTTAEGQITQFDSDISQLQTDTGSLTTRTTSLEGRMDTAEGEIDLKVDTSTFNSLSSTVDGNSASITSLSTVLTNNGLTSSTNISNTVNTVSQTASTNSSKISNLTTTLGTNADGTTKSTDIVHKVSSVEQDLNGFKTTVSSTYATASDLGDLEDRVETAESSITQNANNIALKVSESDVTGNYLVGKINLNSTTATIAAERVNIAGAALFTGNGRLSQTSLDNAYDANGAAATAQSNAISTAAADATAKANAANAKEQLIYISAQSGTSSMNETTTWVTDATGAQATWTTKRPQYNSSYPVLFVATQRQTVGGTVTCTTPMIDDTTTVIDGGNIITGSVTANKLNAANINASGMLSVGALDSAANAEIDDAAKTATNYITADATGINVAKAGETSTYQRLTANSTDFVVGNAVRNRIDSDGMTIYDGTGTDDTDVVADFGANVTIGAYGGTQLRFNASDGLVVRTSTNQSGGWVSSGAITTITPSLIRLQKFAGLGGSSTTLSTNSSTVGYPTSTFNIDEAVQGSYHMVVNGGKYSSSTQDTYLGGDYVQTEYGLFDAVAVNDYLYVYGPIKSDNTQTIYGHSLVTTASGISDATTVSSATGGTGVFFRNNDEHNLGYIRSYASAGSDRKRGIQFVAANDESTVTNTLYLLVDKDGNRSVVVSESKPWRDAINPSPLVTEAPSAVSVASETWTTLGSISVTVGTWVFSISTTFANNSSGRRAVYFGTSSTGSSITVGAMGSSTMAPAVGGMTKYSNSHIGQVSGNTTYYCRAWQNSGSALSCQCYLRAVRIV